MSKVIVIFGCKACPYRHCDSKDWNLWSCTHGEFPLLDGKVDGLDAELPETPHPNCKLNDLPSGKWLKSEMRNYDYGMMSDFPKGYLRGANDVLKEITK